MSNAPEPAASPVLLMRLRVDGLDWSEHLPPAPAGNDVSVSFTRPATAARHAELLAELGYRLVAVHRDGHAAPGEFVDMVIYGDTTTRHSSWWRAVSALAERIYPLELGPAALRWADVVGAHVEAADGGTGAHAWRVG